MDEIDMYPDPSGGWVMMCPCGAAETRGRKATRWTVFELRWLDKQRYRMTCLACGHITEQAVREVAFGT